MTNRHGHITKLINPHTDFFETIAFLQVINHCLHVEYARLNLPVRFRILNETVHFTYNPSPQCQIISDVEVIFTHLAADYAPVWKVVRTIEIPNFSPDTMRSLYFTSLWYYKDCNYGPAQLDPFQLPPKILMVEDVNNNDIPLTLFH